MSVAAEPLAPAVPAAYAHWRSRARALLEPLADLMSPGRAATLPRTARTHSLRNWWAKISG